MESDVKWRSFLFALQFLLSSAAKPAAIEFDCINKLNKGANYYGTASKTSSGLTCQRWDSQTPHAHTYTNPNLFPDATLADAANYCRPTNDDVMPWCWTTDPATTWQYCEPIKYCRPLDDYFACAAVTWAAADKVVIILEHSDANPETCRNECRARGYRFAAIKSETIYYTIDQPTFHDEEFSKAECVCGKTELLPHLVDYHCADECGWGVAANKTEPIPGTVTLAQMQGNGCPGCALETRYGGIPGTADWCKTFHLDTAQYVVELIWQNTCWNTCKNSEFCQCAIFTRIGSNPTCFLASKCDDTPGPKLVHNIQNGPEPRQNTGCPGVTFERYYFRMNDMGAKKRRKRGVTANICI